MKNRLFEIRTQILNMSQAELAEFITSKGFSCTQQYVSRYENGKTEVVNMYFENLICDAAGISIDYLRCRTHLRNEEKNSKMLKKVEALLGDLYSDSNEKKQDLSDEELAFFIEFVHKFKDLLKSFPKQ